MIRLLRAKGHLTEKDRVIRIKSWRPTLTREGIEWPTLLIDQGYRRLTITPVWPWRSPPRA